MSAQRGASTLQATQDAALPLRDAVHRALRGSHPGWTVLVLHLSRLAPPAPRPHHSRIARAVLTEAASRHQGQLFTLISGDLALLFPNDNGVVLAAALGNLFAADAPDQDLLLSRWSLPDHRDELYAFLDALPMLSAAPKHAERESGLGAAAALFDGVEPRRIRELLDRQTGVLLTTAGAMRLMPIYREIRFSLPALEARATASGHVSADSFLFHHLIAKLDGAMLQATTADLDHNRPMLAGVAGGALTLHVNMSLETVLSPAFEVFSEAADRAQARVAVEIALLEAFADTDAFGTARARVRDAGFALVLDDVTHHALMVTNPAALGCDWLKLDWSRQMLQAGQPLERAIQEIGPSKIILQGADSEEAVRWGVARGIRRFQGRHTDAILAAGRLEVCPAAAGCTLRQCIARESAATPSGRTGCQNPSLLDRSAIDPEQPA